MKKKNLLMIALVSLLTVAILPACRNRCVKGSGHQITESYNVANFNELEISGAFRVNLKQDSSLALSITTDDNLMKYIHVESDGERLHIYNKKSVCGSGEMILNIGIKQLSRLTGSGAVNFVSAGKINAKDLHIGLNGASSVNLDLTADNVSTEGTGSSEIDLKGQATSHRVQLTGAGKLRAFDFVVGKYDIRSTGAADCEINVLTDLQVSSTGASDVKYKGNPANVNSTKLGAGTVTHVN